jgi:hypothetical protein
MKRRCGVSTALPCALRLPGRRSASSGNFENSAQSLPQFFRALRPLSIAKSRIAIAANLVISAMIGEQFPRIC